LKVTLLTFIVAAQVQDINILCWAGYQITYYYQAADKPPSRRQQAQNDHNFM
jgi:hypothetical protein